MSLSTTVIIGAAVAAWLLVVALVWLYCVSAARADRQAAASEDRSEQTSAAEGADAKRTARG